MKKILRSGFVGGVLTLVVFYVVTYCGIILFSYFSEEKVSPGKEVPGRFYVVAEPGENGAAFSYFSYSELAEQISGNKPSFRMSKSQGFVDTGNFRVRYKVLENNETSQLIEVAAGEDENIIGKYRVTANMITPVSWRSCGIGQMFASFPIALLIAYLFHRLWKRLQRQNS